MFGVAHAYARMLNIQVALSEREEACFGKENLVAKFWLSISYHYFEDAPIQNEIQISFLLLFVNYA